MEGSIETPEREGIKKKNIKISSGKSNYSFIPACIQVHVEILLYVVQKNI